MKMEVTNKSTIPELVHRLIDAYLGTANQAAVPKGDIDYPLMEQFKREVDQWIRSDARRALQIAELAESLSKKASDPRARALGARMRAMALHVQSRYAEALESYEQARSLYAAAGCDVDRARVERAMVDACIYLGGYDDALRLAEQAREVFTRHHETLLLAQLESNAGNIYHRLDRNLEALACYDRADREFAALDDRDGLARVSFNRANVYCNLDDYQQAEILYQRAYDLHTELENPTGAMQARYSLGYLHFLRGAYHQAMRILAEVRIEAIQLGDEQTAALCILDLAEIYLQLNVLDDAATLATDARRLFERLEMRYEAARALTFLGIASLRQEKLADAERAFIEARKEFEAEGNQVHLGMISLHQAEMHLFREDWLQAKALAAEAREIFGRQQLRARACAAQIVEARALLGSGDRSREQCETIEALCGELDLHWLKVQAHELLGDVALAEGQAANAYEQYAASIACIEQIRSSIRVDEFRSAFFRDKLRVYEKLISLCLDEQTPHRQAEAFYYLEASKSRTLVDLLVNEIGMMPEAASPQAAELHRRWKELREKLHWHYNKSNRIESQGKSRLLGADERARHEIASCEQELSALMRQLQYQDPHFQWLKKHSGITVEELRGLLDEDEIVLEYYFDRNQLEIFVIDWHSLCVRTGPVDVQAIGELVQKLRFQLNRFQYGSTYVAAHAARMLREARECLHQLWQALIAPVADLLRERKLIIVPFGGLHNVPFQALYDGERYLIETNELTQMPSAQLLKSCSIPASRNYEHALLIGAADEIAPQITQETQAIRNIFPEARCFLGEEATGEALLRHAGESDILHIASHAVFRQDNPMFSAFKLADKWLNFYDICGLKLPASLVTLSGCSTGTSRISAGDELLGLARGFLTAGADSLVVSLWEVDDVATARLMTSFYQQLRCGKNAAAALRRAVIEIQGIHEHPYYWAPFVLISRI